MRACSAVCFSSGHFVSIALEHDGERVDERHVEQLWFCIETESRVIWRDKTLPIHEIVGRRRRGGWQRTEAFRDVQHEGDAISTALKLFNTH